MCTRRARTVMAALCAMAAATACTASTAVTAQEEVLVLEVAPQRAACVGEMVQSCLQVRAPDQDAWRLFYEPIDGFEHEAGVTYTLEVLRTEVENPPADASRYTYRLIRVLERTPAGDG